MIDLIKTFKDIDCNIEENVSLKKYSTFKVGGIGKLVVCPDTIDKFVKVITICRENNQDYFILGNGSNILFDDNGYDNVIISTRKLRNISIDGEYIHCECGAVLASIGFKAAKDSLTGFERLSGIPGTIGGAVVMNAGAYGSEFKDVLVSIKALDVDGNVIELRNDDLGFDYRTSNIKEKKLIVLSATIKLEKGDAEEIAETMDVLRGKRIKSQPLEFPNAGSIFKRNGDFIPGKAIDECGLKGYSIGGAMVSPKHANFIVNFEKATSSDVKNLIQYIKSLIKEKYNQDIHTEIEMI